MSTVNFSGLSTGIDSATIIEKMVYLERAPIRKMETNKSNYQSQLSIIQSINSKLQSLQTKATDLKTIGDFLSYSATSNDEDSVTATASGTAVPGTYTVDIGKLAKAERTYSDSFADKEAAAAAGTGTLTITVGSDEDVLIGVTAEDTLETIVGKINSSEARVSAGLLYDGSEYRIQVTGTDTGAENFIDFGETTGLSLGLETATAYQEAQDAELKIDGFDIVSPDNEVENAVTGVTLTLHDEAESAVEIVVSPDEASIKTKIEELVNSYNEISSLIHNEFKFTGEAKNQNHLSGDSTLRSLQLQLSSAMGNEIENLGSSFSALSQIGITTSTDGTLAIDASELESAIAADVVGVGRLFSGTADHSVDGIGDRLDDMVDRFVDFTDGILTAKKDGLNTRIDNIDDSIVRYENRAVSLEERMRMEFTQLEVMVSSLTSQSNFLANQKFLW